MDPGPTGISPLSLPDALPISTRSVRWRRRYERDRHRWPDRVRQDGACHARRDRKSTRLNSSHRTISYAVFCLKKKIKIKNHETKNKNMNKQVSMKFAHGSIRQ